jgi:Type II CAAX prenyl endopeptidase Rce1-like
MKLYHNPSFRFFLPYVIIATVIFLLTYILGLNKYLGAVDGYGWSNSILLDRIFGFLNIKVDPKYYITCFVVFYFIVSVPLQELVFRVWPLQYFNSKLTYVAVTSLIFMLCHIYYMQLPGLILTGGLGILTSYDYWNNKNFWAICIIHAILASMAFTLNLA